MQRTDLDDDLEKKSKLIGGFFSHIKPELHTYARKEKQLAELILCYTGDLAPLDNEQKTYDRTALQKQHAKKAKDDLLQAIPLSIIDVDTASQKEKVCAELQAWSLLAKKEHTKYESLLENTKHLSDKEREHLRFKEDFFFMHVAMLAYATRNYTRFDNMSIVVDDKQIIQAVSFSSADPRNKHACYVNAIVTAPHNHIEGHPARVKGAGSALIEDAIQKSIKRQGLSIDTPLTFDMMKNTAVTLEQSASDKFYCNLFFEVDKRRSFFGNYRFLVLNQENLFRFLENYGGRAGLR